jgi:hypothetical protein
LKSRLSKAGWPRVRASMGVEGWVGIGAIRSLSGEDYGSQVGVKVTGIFEG